ncbi:MAG: bifunctional phosphoribosylaminoimidazolecarboxamide formyltransferase/IMP cyclohydrolase [Euryarchaeota archaeon]|nr:bifunctional phosphoribosylaminoimidazolecarboxamide formyltransferase/IMP cyclohydrolase [Euryarchaeota archaeon]
MCCVTAPRYTRTKAPSVSLGFKNAYEPPGHYHAVRIVGTRDALLSVSDKTGIVELARGLVGHGMRVVSTGGTAKTLREAGVGVTEVAEVTGFPEMLDGRVKTTHPRIHAGILAVRSRPDHLAALEKNGIRTVDLVAVNLYPFEETVGKGAKHEEVLEQIDIGGPSIIRAAAKNYRDVAVLTSPSQYRPVLEELEKTGGLTAETRQRLAAEAFAHTARYDTIIDQYFRRQVLKDDFPQHLNLSFERIQNLRYGENSHQRAAFFAGKPTKEPCVVNAKQIHGKELSFNNILDVDTAIECAKEFSRPSVVIVKHATPCGIASSDSISQAFKLAYQFDTYSPYGGVVGLNREVDEETARQLADIFLEVVVAPGFVPHALALLEKKKNVRLLEVKGFEHHGHFAGLQFRGVVGGLLVQDRDIREPDVSTWKVVTKVHPSPKDMRSMLFAFKAVRHVRSNSVIFVKEEHTIAIGGGQTSRVDATFIATKKGGENIRGSIMASEAFFPFRDSIDQAAKAGVVGIVQPGGSIRDEECIAAADEAGIAMVFTGQRAFRH